MFNSAIDCWLTGPGLEPEPHDADLLPQPVPADSLQQQGATGPELPVPTLQRDPVLTRRAPTQPLHPGRAQSAVLVQCAHHHRAIPRRTPWSRHSCIR